MKQQLIILKNFENEKTSKLKVKNIKKSLKKNPWVDSINFTTKTLIFLYLAQTLQIFQPKILSKLWSMLDLIIYLLILNQMNFWLIFRFNRKTPKQDTFQIAIILSKSILIVKIIISYLANS